MSRLREITRRVVAALDPGEHYIPPPAGAPAAAVAGYRATQDGGAEEAVRRVEAAEGAVIRATQLAQQWKINAQSATDPGIAVVALFAAEQLLAALAPQAGDGAR